MLRHPAHRRGLLGGAAIFAILAMQRWELAGLAQWREDQATNLWLGTQMWRELSIGPIGLINSLGSPNPSGMNWLGLCLGVLPSLRSISFALGLMQLGLLARLCWLLFEDIPSLFWASLLASGACLQVVLFGVEFFAQWTLGMVNLVFFIALVQLQRGSRPLWPSLLIVNCILAAPALYLAGVLNSVGYAVLSALVIVNRPADWREVVGGVWRRACWAGVFLAHGLLVWLPFARGGGFSEIRGLSRPLAQRVGESALTLVDLPVTLYRLLPRGIDSLPQVTPDLMPPSFYFALQVTRAGVAILILLSTIWALWRRHFSPTLLMSAFVLLLGVMSPLVGGFSWGMGQRPDQALQFLPLLLVVAFGALSRSPRVHAPLLGLALVFSGVHLGLSQQLHVGLVGYHGPRLGEADLPLDDRRRAVDFVGADWLSQSGDGMPGSRASIFYSFGDRRLYDEPEVANWVAVSERFGAILSRWYPDAPYTIGRAYDWELMRRWHVGNQDDGIPQHDREWRGHRYTLSMVGLPIPPYLPSSAHHHEFGRVRVSVVEEP